MDSRRFVVYIIREDIYSGISKGVETRLNVSNYELDKQFPKEKKQKINWINER